MLLVQDPSRPNTVLDAIVSLSSADTTQFRALVAYATLSGCEALVPRVAAAVGKAWGRIPKVVITSFDYGITEPDALVQLVDAGFQVRIANIGEGGTISLMPVASAFHPKAYIFDDPVRMSALVGSPNLTRRALTVNVEAAYVVDAIEDVEAVERQWSLAVEASTPLTAELLALYREKRPDALRAPRPSREPRPPARPHPPTSQPTFAQAILDGAVHPSSFNAFWVEAGRMSSSGSHAQLELPRGGNRFFGFNFEHYDHDHHVIGEPVLIARGIRYYHRRLTWHGNNRMERINLPTRAQSGLEYPQTAILFRRVEDGFTVEVRPWDSDDAKAWRNESEAASNIFRLGEKTARICGLL